MTKLWRDQVYGSGEPRGYQAWREKRNPTADWPPAQNKAATVTNYKLTIGEHSIIINALDQYQKFLDDTIASMSPRDGRGLREQRIKLNDLKNKLYNS